MSYETMTCDCYFDFVLRIYKLAKWSLKSVITVKSQSPLFEIRHTKYK
jgi:hypothetical protein